MSSCIQQQQQQQEQPSFYFARKDRNIYSLIVWIWVVLLAQSRLYTICKSDLLPFPVSNRIQICFAVNNAGVSLFTIFDCFSMDLAKETFDINFFGTLRLIKAVLPSMKARQSGHIINNGSAFGVVGAPFFEIYSASKFAVDGLTESLVPTLRQFNIRQS